MNLLFREPVLAVGVLQAVLAVAIAFGADLSDGQSAALVGLAAAVLALLGAARQAVTPMRKVTRIADELGGTAVQLVGLLAGKGRTAERDPLHTAEGDSRIADAEAELRRSDGEDGSIPMALLIAVGLVVVMLIGMAVCGDALFEDEDEQDDLGAPAWVMDDDGDREDHNSESERGCAGAEEPCESREASPSFEDSPVKDSFNIGPVCVMDGACRFDDEA